MKKTLVVLLVLVMIFVMVGSTSVARQETGPYGLGYWKWQLRQDPMCEEINLPPYGQDGVYDILTARPIRGDAETLCKRHLFVGILNFMNGHVDLNFNQNFVEWPDPVSNCYYVENYYFPAFASINSYMIEFNPWLAHYYVENPTRQQYLEWKDGIEEWIKTYNN